MKKASRRKISDIVMGLALAASLLYGGSMMGCENGIKNTSTVKPKLESVETKVASNTNALKGTTGIIKTEALSILDITPPEFKPLIDPHTQAIITQTTEQEKIIKSLESTKGDFALVKKAAETDANVQKQVVAENEKLREQISSQSRKTVAGWSTSCFFVALISGVAYGYTKNKALLGIAATAGIGMLACLMIIQLLPILPFIALGLGILLVFAVGYELLQNNRAKAALAKTNGELVHGIETIKPRLTVTARRQVFGDGPIDGELTKSFSDNTKDLVNTIRLDPTFKRAPSIPATIAIDLNGDGIIDANEIAECKDNQNAVRASIVEGHKEFSVGGTKIILK